MTALDYVLIAVIALCVAGALIYIIRRRRRGCGSCGSCPHAASCRSVKKDRKR